jgi:hypothetical protein
MMLAGFNASGDPIVHDPARSNGYSYVFKKSDLSHSWFDKGGVGYTFFPAANQSLAVDQPAGKQTVVEGFELNQNYPNPFNPATTIEFSIPQQSQVTMKVFDVLGHEVAELVNEKKDAGNYSVSWDAGQFPSGLYFYILRAGDRLETKRMILMK